MMRRVSLALLLSCLLFGAAGAEQPVYFADAHLKEAVEAELWISNPTPTDMLGLTAVHGQEHGISDLKGLEYAVNLRTLVATYGKLNDLSPLSGLVHLETLVISNNAIYDISALSNLSALEYLDVHDNHVSDVSSLSGLTELQTVIIRSNSISDISAFSSLSNLRELIIFDNGIRDISALTALTSLEHVDVRNNPLDKEACATHIPQIIANNPGVDLEYDPCVRHRVILSSTVGGAIVEPGEGEYIYDNGATIVLRAQAGSGFTFAGFSGTYSTNENPTLLTVEQSHQIRANFERVGNALYVDDDAVEDPGPGDARVSDPEEAGTPEHPFDRIQEALDAAEEGAVIFVHSGVYPESIHFPARTIELKGGSLAGPASGGWPVIQGAVGEPVVSFTDSPGRDCLLSGFVLTGGRGRLAGAVYCSRSSPTISNCLIAGNRQTDPNGAIIYCAQSSATFTNCTLAGNVAGHCGAGLLVIDSHVTVVNSILWGNSPTEVLCLGTGELSVHYSDILGGWPGASNLAIDPLFADAGRWAGRGTLPVTAQADVPDANWIMGDYHVQSQIGRWDPTATKWQRDALTSPCIDAGDPNTPVGQEPAPNGRLVNLGAYGGTAEASKSPGAVIGVP